MVIEFTHPLDSHLDHEHDEPKPDVGTFTILPDGDELEIGEMAAPHLGGKVTPYEEVWHELDAGLDALKGRSGVSPSWILESVDARVKSYYGRAGKFFLGLRQTVLPGADDGRLTFSALRQELDTTSGRWSTKYSMGKVDGMFRMDNVDGDDSLGQSWSVGDKIRIGRSNEPCVVKAIVKDAEKA